VPRLCENPCPCRKLNPADNRGRITQSFCSMSEACRLIWTALIGLFRSRASLAAEILVLRHQINVLRRNSPKRQTFSVTDRLIFAGLYRLAPTKRSGGCEAGDRHKMAPRRVQILLALEVAAPWWSTNHSA
jgi:hypothetical protein